MPWMRSTIIQQALESLIKHNIINVDSKTQLKMYTIYAPPYHKDGIVQVTQKDAVDKEAEFDGKATE